MRVLLLGASGRTGGRLLDELTARGHQLAVVVPSLTGPSGPADIEIHRGDVGDLAVQRFGGAVVTDVEHHAHLGRRRTSISRAALARFVADEFDHSRYPGPRPLIAAR